MPTDPIGEIPVLIIGDYSQLEGAIGDAIRAAGEGAAQIAGAFRSSDAATSENAENINRLTSAYNAATSPVQAFSDRLRDLQTSGMTLKEALSADADMLSRMETASRTAGDAAKAASVPLMSMGDALSEFANSAAAKQSADSMATALTELGASAGRVLPPLKDTATAATSISESFSGMSNALSAAGRTLGMIIAPIDAMGGASVKMAADFELGMRKVTSLMGEVSEGTFRKLSDQTLELSRVMGIDAVKATGALYEAVSAGIPPENAISFLGTASKAAIAGVTDTKVAVDALTTVLNAYHMSTDKAREVSDQMFMAVNIGKFNFEQLASAIGKAVPMAAEFGVSFQEVAASAATITRSGISVSEAMTQISSAMRAVISPNKEMNALIHETGFASGAAMLAGLGFQGTLLRLRDAANDNDTALAKAFGRIEGFRGVLELTGKNASIAAEDMEKVGTAAEGVGAATLAYNEINKSTTRQFEMLQAEVKASAIAFGASLLPTVRELLTESKPFVSELEAWGKGFAALPQDVKTTGVELAGLITVIAGGTLVLGTFARSLESIGNFKYGQQVAELAALLPALGLLGTKFLELNNAERDSVNAEAAHEDQLRKLEQALKRQFLDWDEGRQQIDKWKAAVVGGTMTAEDYGKNLRSISEEYRASHPQAEIASADVLKLTQNIKDGLTVKEKDLDVAKQTLQHLKETGASANEVAAAQARVTAAANALHPAFSSLKDKAAAAKDEFKELSAAYKVWADSLNHPEAYGSIIERINALGNAAAGAGRTILQGAKDQAEAFVKWESSTALAGKSVEVLTGHTAGLGKAMTDVKLRFDESDHAIENVANATGGMTVKVMEGIPVLTGHANAARAWDTVLADSQIKMSGLGNESLATGSKLSGMSIVVDKNTTSASLLAQWMSTMTSSMAGAEAEVTPLGKRLEYLDSVMEQGISTAGRLSKAIGNVLGGGMGGESILGGSLGAASSGGLTGSGGKGTHGGGGGGAPLFEEGKGGAIVDGRNIYIYGTDYYTPPKKEEGPRPTGTEGFQPTGLQFLQGINGLTYQQGLDALKNLTPAVDSMTDSTKDAIPSAQGLANTVAQMTGTFSVASSTLLTQAANIAAAAGISAPGSFGPAVTPGTGTPGSPPLGEQGFWSASQMVTLGPPKGSVYTPPVDLPASDLSQTMGNRRGLLDPRGGNIVNIYNPTITNKKLQDQLVEQLQNAGLNHS